MQYRFFGIFTLINLLFCLVSSCDENSQLASSYDGKGRLKLETIKIEISVDDVKTRGVVTAPLLSDLLISIINISTNEQYNLSSAQTDIVLDVGNYKLIAVYGEDICSIVPYYYGEKEFVILQGQTTIESLTVSLASAVIHPIMTDDLLSHFTSYQLVVSSELGSYEVTNNSDFFVSATQNYTLTFSGINLLGETKTNSWDLINVLPKTRYNINCNPDLPAFTLPTQVDGDVWSKFIYITPMTSLDMIAKPEMADKVIANVIYEASADGVTWHSATLESDRWIIKGLSPSTPYTIRSRFGGVVSVNTQVVTTESAQQLENGDMENWSSTQIYGGSGAISAAINCNYCTGWATRNEKTTDGASGANGNIIASKANYAVYWKWYSNTISTSDCSNGSKAAEISTLGLYNGRVYGSWSRSEVLSYTQNDGTVYVGYLFLGSFDKNSDSYTQGVEHTARPISISFDYKYAPNNEDNFSVNAELLDINKNRIASIIDIVGSAQSSYQTIKADLNYIDRKSKAAYICVFFKSGHLTTISNLIRVNGGYDASPFKYDRIVGSVLKIDNIVLNYE